MIVTRKRTAKSSVQDLIAGINRLAYLLDGQKEEQAAEDLRIAASDLQKYVLGSMEFTAAIALIKEAFEGEHELLSYTLRRQDSGDDSWGDPEDLYLASTKVWSLVKQLNP